MNVRSQASLGPVLRAIVRHSGVQRAAALWVVAYAVVLLLARGALPFDHPAVARFPFAAQMATPTITLIEIFGLMVLAFLVTRKRSIPDMAARAPRDWLPRRRAASDHRHAADGEELWDSFIALPASARSTTR
jgi:hypothetical protein